MLDVKTLRDDPAAFDAALARRGLPAVANDLLEKDKVRRADQTRMQLALEAKNKISKTIGEAKAKGEDATKLMADVAELKRQIEAAEVDERAIADVFERQLAALPNTPAADVPQGKDEKDNKEIRRFGEPRENEKAKEHFDLGEALGLMDFDNAAKLSGSRFTVLKGQLARLERALGNFMLDTHTGEFGYTEMSPPLMVRQETMYGIGQLPKFSEDLFQTTRGDWLIPTAEVPLTAMVMDRILDATELPLRFTAKTPCFRSEAGAAGRDTRGMLRQHQFYKVELVSVTEPDKSEEEHERMTQCAETILKRLELPFRTMLLCTGDMGFASRKTYDIEVWMPGQNTYREISSCSNCGDFQARRMKARFKRAGDKQAQLVHTLNGSGLAVGRTLIAILENNQQQDGSIIIPAVLRGYMGGQDVIKHTA